MNVVKYGPTVAVSRELLDDAAVFRQAMLGAVHEMYLDRTVGPRYGPPVPFREPERCEHCGHILDEDDDR